MMKPETINMIQLITSWLTNILKELGSSNNISSTSNSGKSKNPAIIPNKKFEPLHKQTLQQLL